MCLRHKLVITTIAEADVALSEARTVSQRLTSLEYAPNAMQPVIGIEAAFVAERLLALDEWLSKNGALPTSWRRGGS